jgi:hypothetical protein
MSFSELRAARDWCEAVGVLLTPDVLLAVGLLPNPETRTVPDTVRCDLLAASWGNA